MYSSPLSILAELGLNEQEGRAYIALLEMGTGSITEIAQQSGIKRTSVYNFIDRLIEIGVVTQRIQGKKRMYQASPPESLVDLQERKLHVLRERIGELSSLANMLPAKPRISYFQGVEQMKQLSYEQTRCNRLCQAIWPNASISQIVGGPDFAAHVQQMRIKAGVHLNVIRFPNNDMSFPGSDPSPDDLREIRVAKGDIDFPMSINLYDTGKVAFIATKNDGYAFLIESNELYRSMSRLFEMFWETGTVPFDTEDNNKD